MKLAVTGKGGVGKTSLSFLLGLQFQQRGYRVLLVDCDPDSNLPDLMGIPANEVTPISEMKKLIDERTGSDREGSTWFTLNPRVDDIPDTYAIERFGLKLLVMGSINKGGSGCACPLNAFIRQLLRHLIVDRDEIVIMDMEAGIEHLGRGTAERVDCLLIVAEPNRTSLTTAKRIMALSDDLGLSQKFLIGNKIVTKEDAETIRSGAAGVPIRCLPTSTGIFTMSRRPGQLPELEDEVLESLHAIVNDLENAFNRRSHIA